MTRYSGQPLGAENIPPLTDKSYNYRSWILPTTSDLQRGPQALDGPTVPVTILKSGEMLSRGPRQPRTMPMTTLS